MPSAASDAPDVNVLLALTDPDHAHHASAKRYWNHLRAKRIVIFRVTLFGLLRLLTNPKSMNGNPFTPGDAWAAGQTYLSLPEVMLLPDLPSIDDHFESWTKARFFTSKLWTDAWLAALALEHGCRVVSFDADFARFPGLDFLHLQR